MALIASNFSPQPCEEGVIVKVVREKWKIKEVRGHTANFLDSKSQ